jgi:hypothetical protein
MNQSVLDANFKFNDILDCGYQLEWYPFNEDFFSLYGVFYDKTEGQFLRLPRKIADATSVGVSWLANQTSGGRLRFCTDSKIIAIKAEEGLCAFKSHIPVTGQMGFALYTDGKYERSFAPDLSAIENRQNETFSFSTFFKTIYPKPNGEFYNYDLYFPLYSSVKQLYVGVIKGSKFQATKKYSCDLPILYYGSSITQGACASHPGNEYQGHISRALDLDYINLGFAGKACGEQVMAEYISSIPHSIFVMDYDNNAPTLEHLEKTHYAFYKTYRKICKDTPVIFITKPNYWIGNDNLGKGLLATTKIIKNSYKKALAEGDKNVYFIDGKTFFGKDLFSCTVDSVHPNDLGFYLMAKKLLPVIKKALNLK